MTLRLDYGNMLAPRLGGRGIEPRRLQRFAAEFRRAYDEVGERRARGEMGFFDLPHARETVSEIRRFADGLGQAFENVVVLGIGGSALGTGALSQALLGAHWNELSDERRDYYPRLYVLENIDPTSIGPFLDRIDLGRTLFNVVSKSGTTAETMAQYLIVAERVRRELGLEAGPRHFLFTTDPESGALRQLANEEGIPTLSVPPNVGGRFSVLSPVGLLPAALAGIDIEAVLAGAAGLADRCVTPELLENPAGLTASLLYLAEREHRANINVFMPYSDRLRALAAWYCQLWAESLGKRLDASGQEVHVGPTPVAAVGATDQHSQFQLYMEGPFDKVVTLLAVRDPGCDVEIPPLYEGIPALAYLGGHSLGELLSAERRATAEALRREGRFNMTIEIAGHTPHALGELIMFYQIATVYAGALYHVDPLDQPGVELGKRLTYGLLGRQGYEAPEIADGDPRWIV
ncbi:MAG: glucose-6-phosphate isomerase [Gemmatimonadetes bacterium]|nr:glucose-6-phosphate isomerase [Gemmatimonadota bacterium]